MKEVVTQQAEWTPEMCVFAFIMCAVAFYLISKLFTSGDAYDEFKEDDRLYKRIQLDEFEEKISAN